jgi:hypothetical protein
MSYREVTDMYEASYFVSHGCKIDAVTIFPQQLTLVWTLRLSGSDIENLDKMYDEGTASVNIRGYMLAEKHVQQRVRESQQKWLSDYKKGKRGRRTYES